MFNSRSSRMKALLCFVSSCALLSQSLNAATLYIKPTAKGYIRSTQNAAAVNNPETTLLLIGDTAVRDDAFRSVFSFDVARSELDGAEILSATLVLKVHSKDVSAGGSVSKMEQVQLYLLEHDFDPVSVDWAFSSAGEKWDRLGGDFGASVATLEVNPTELNAGHKLSLTSEAFTNMIKDSQGQGSSWLLKLADEDEARSVLRLAAADCQLKIEYEPARFIPLANFDVKMEVLSEPLAGQPEVPQADVVPVPGPITAPQSPRYFIYAGGHPVEVKDERYDFDAAMFTKGDTPVLVDVMVEDSFDAYTLKPDRYGVEVERIQDTLRFKLDEPHKLVLQIPGRKPLAIIVTPNETEIPNSSDPDVVYFEPGLTHAGVIRPKSGQTLYFAPGALVKGRIEARDVKNVRVMGRGVLETEGYSSRPDKLHGILFDRSENILVEGIGVRSNDTWWQTLFLNTINAEVAHVNLFGIGVNTDGVDIDAVKDFVVRDSFIRCEDDGLGWHALDAAANGEMITENVLADNLVIWNTRWGNGIRIGASMEAQLWRDITIRNIDILMHAHSGIYSDYSDWAWMDNLKFENVTIEKPSVPISFYIEETRYSNSNGYLKARGHMHGLLFENVTMTGGGIYLKGADAKHRINAVWFNNCTNGGRLLDSPHDVKVNPFVTNVHFNKPFEPIVRESAPGVYELEDYESMIGGGVQYLIEDAGASLGRVRVFESKQAGAYIEHLIPVSESGAYRLQLMLKASRDLDPLAVSLNGEVVASPRVVASTSKAFTMIDCGMVQVDRAGSQKIRLSLPDDIDGGIRLELDAIRLEAK